VAADAAGRIYVSDSVRNRVFRFSPQGEWIDSVGDTAGFTRPTGLSADRKRDRLHVVDTTTHRIVSLDGDGEPVRIIGTRGTGNGEFNYPVAVTVDGRGRMFVTDSMNFRVQVLDPDGRFLHSFGRAGNGPGDFDKAKGIAVDAAGHIYVVEALHDVIHVYDQDGRLLTVIGGTGDGAGEFWLPAGIVIDHADRIWIADSANHRLQVLRILEPPDDGGRG
jgi:sugar lactone lactonase YvrE